ncbi:SymE family type I addiction module toxin [Dickeya solani]|uniref:SymE family type I addiction module toxin n=1 Tax=Dickeya solani TaxID=1089444 RepID=A0ABU4EBU0_9GAMM|nr:SymE family type I addiction module toxin [Dickeya solani]MDV7008071.1 SymE family type I addiction module toxin [Dickeya solani]MDV7041476.1 SymE family type I addiction module toxin [Dickeya solani]
MDHISHLPLPETEEYITSIPKDVHLAIPGITEGTDQVGDNGELTLAGDWLTQCGLLTPPFSIEALPGRIILRTEPGAMLA